ncbi:AAA family ATPase [Peribacillus simplex]|uniref:AAA family ATPase n=1 Tax=Peribacillus simplex TaxID=1478 RepID=UPI00298E91F1|nr:AAA family ATPase [Peribacillus simplex]MDW7615168.1 AAA family ATPase [Peribacillus simplex]
MERQITVFHGPVNIFKNRIESNDIIYLRNIVSEIDQKSFERWLERQAEKTIPSDLVCYTESYASITESFLGELPVMLKILTERGALGTCFFQNPPVFLQEGLIQEFGSDSVKIEQHEYDHISKKDMVTLYKNYSIEVLGQDEAIKDILSTIYPLSSGGYASPIVVMFYGPAGVGKTETANLISKNLFDGELFRQQFSMFQTGEAISYLFGDTLNKTSFARDLMNRESNVILLDEFDKCPPYFYSAFYQMFDEGVYIDKNYKVDLKNTVIICTTNYESEHQILERLGGAIFSRFDKFIRFTNLSFEDKQKLIKDTYSKYSILWSDKEKEVLQDEMVLEKILVHTDRFTNARNINQGVKSYISRVLFENLIKESDEI